MRKRILSVILTIGLITSIVGCGVSEKETISSEIESNEAQIVENKADDTVMDDVLETVETEETVSEDKEVDGSIGPKDYEEQKDVFVYKNIDIGDGTQINLTDGEIVIGPFILTESIDVYSNYLTYAGYTKSDIKIDSVKRVDNWVMVPFAQSGFLVKAEDFDRVAVLEEKEENDSSEDYLKAVIESAPQPGGSKASAQNNGDSSSDNKVSSVTESTSQSESIPQTEAPAPTVTTYSEAEVISIVENALREAGFRKPEEIYSADLIAEFGPDAGMGWGIEDIPMNDPYTAASKIVEGFQFAKWTTYYIENQGSSNGYVHLKLYSGS